MSRKPNGRKLRPREQQAIDAQKLFAHLTNDGSLWDNALCQGATYPDWWHPATTNHITLDEIATAGMALEICSACPIREQCLEVCRMRTYALVSGVGYYQVNAWRYAPS